MQVAGQMQQSFTHQSICAAPGNDMFWVLSGFRAVCRWHDAHRRGQVSAPESFSRRGLSSPRAAVRSGPRTSLAHARHFLVHIMLCAELPCEVNFGARVEAAADEEEGRVSAGASRT